MIVGLTGGIGSGKSSAANFFIELGIDVIDANEGSFVFSKDIVKQYEIVLKAQEGSQISVITETKQLIVKSVTGSAITTTGTSENQEITIRDA